ncbi:hypothetical protein GGTG_03998 [Gaeumannomyces tritici R3-111a-1]|uniref:Uncharacterized protein n=1 Tax=Gaeumannomyces tritici (strain R3-111a-1) TaxID=644352 RepID=J3NRU9_GAET3|nr:hypothetical protein GGTG_03998 [Gaeumannomyces tritici R3-111a-1]EJT78905.1 hypothetical protein GGTG_03998 [Gaeumannomyces tritici R3-111a-1]
MRYHAKNTQGNAWQYEETGVRDVKSTNLLLVRVLIAKVVDEERLAQVMRSSSGGTGGCVGTSVLDWNAIETTAKKYAGENTDAGRFRDTSKVLWPKPTWDMLDGRELFP